MKIRSLRGSLSGAVTLVLATAFLSACGGRKSTGGPTLDAPFDTSGFAAAGWEWFSPSTQKFAGVAATVVDPQGKPVEGAKVRLLLFPPIPAEAPKAIQTTATDAKGRFAWSSVPQNSWVEASKSGYGGTIVNVGDLAAEHPKRKGPARIALRTAGRIAGTVRREDGTPLAGYLLMASSGPPDWTGTTSTDARGRFVFADVPPERVHLGGLPSEYLSPMVDCRVKAGATVDVKLVVRKAPPIIGRIEDAETGHPIKGAVVLAIVRKPLVVKADDQGRFEIQAACQPTLRVRAPGYGARMVSVKPLRKAAEHIVVRMERGCGVAGRVVDDEGKPVSGARILIAVRRSKGGAMYHGGTTNSKGRYVCNWLTRPQGGERWYVLAEKPGYATSASRAVVLRAGKLKSGVKVTMARPVKLRLRVVDEDMKPVVHARVSVHYDSAHVVPALRPFLDGGVDGRTDEDGKLGCDGLRPGPYALSVRVPHMIEESSTIQVRGGMGIQTLQVSRDLSLAGTVRSVGGRVLRHVEITLSRKDGTPIQKLHVSPSGEFRISGLKKGSYQLNVVADGYQPSAVNTEAGATHLKIALRPSGSLTIRFRWPNGKHASGTLEVLAGSMESQRDVLRRKLDATEEKIQISSLPSGPCVVRGQAGNLYGRVEANVPIAGKATVTLTMKRGGAVSGLVLLPDGTPATGVGVDYEAKKGWGGGGTRTDDSGRYEFKGLPPGATVVKVHPEPYAPAESTVAIRAGATMKLDLRVKKGAQLSVQVVDPAGHPLEGVSVAIVRPGGALARYWVKGSTTARTDGKGKVVMMGLPAGKYLVSLSLGQRHAERKVSVSDGATDGFRTVLGK